MSNEISAGIIGFIIGVFSGAVGKILADWFRDYRNRLKTPVTLDIAPTFESKIKKQIAICFGVAVDQGDEQVKNAYPKCNGQRYPWIVNGNKIEKLDLHVGEEPNWFSPYTITFDYIDDISTEKNVQPIMKRKQQSEHGIALTVQERNTNDIIFSRLYSIPVDAKSLKHKVKKGLFPINILLIAEQGIKRKRNFSGDLILKRFNVKEVENGIPSMDSLDCHFLLEIVGSWV